MSPKLSETSVETLLGWVNQELDRAEHSATDDDVLFPNLEPESGTETEAKQPLPDVNWTQSQIDSGRNVYEQRLTQAFINKEQQSKLTHVSTEAFRQGVQHYQEQVATILADYVSICSMLKNPRSRYEYFMLYLPETEWLEEAHRMNEDGPLKYVIGLRKKLAISLKKGISSNQSLDEIYFQLPGYFKLFWPNIQTVRAAFSSLLPEPMKQS